MTEAVIVAAIGALAVITAGLPAALIERARKENADDHAFVRRRLDRIDDVAETLTSHVDAEEAHGGRTGRTDTETESDSHTA